MRPRHLKHLFSTINIISVCILWYNVNSILNNVYTVNVRVYICQILILWIQLITYCFICGLRKVAVSRHRMICLVLARICFVFTALYLPSRALEDNTVHINLRTGFVKGYSPYMSFIESPKAIPGNSCNKQVVLKIDFSGKYDGAKFTLLYGEPPTFWTLDISDSPTGDGYGGDNGTTSYMAELQIRNKQLRIYGNWPSGSHGRLVQWRPSN